MPMNDFYFTTMGIRLIVLCIIVEVCLLNSRQIFAWNVVSRVSRLLSPESGPVGHSSVRSILESRLEYVAGEVDKGAFTFDRNVNKQSTNDTWTELVLTIQWPQSFCIEYNDSGEKGKCQVPEGIDDWTIHGLWPSNPGQVGPAFCNDTWKFDITKISDIEKQMNTSWPNCITDEPYDSLWSHEWDKHGTCASSLPALYGEHNYFQQTLSLRKQYDIKGMLEASAVVPSDTNWYMYQTINNAVKDVIGTDPTLTCVYDKKTERVYLSQIEFCLDKDFKLIDCVAPNSASKSNLRDENCEHDKKIYYPMLN
ncbi:ribonuclease Oy-like [Lytechinus pictus]|uniref:ribonuclease Oy-like n=1 Tax=Lytechinus pictus TaxID=7653 RepID=UPI0030B9D90E